MTVPAAESPPPRSGRGSAKSPERVDTVAPAETTSVTLAEKEADARRSIAQRLVWAYVVLLAFSVVIPTALIWIPHVTTTAISDSREMMLAMSGTLSGLVGILGFVMGYYFKSLDKSSETTASSKKPGNK
jgi:hypothetical protein